LKNEKNWRREKIRELRENEKRKELEIEREEFTS